ncbi:MAG: hypothetical protein ABSG43_16220 [Solirubrobacteraceae bacterium]
MAAVTAAIGTLAGGVGGASAAFTRAVRTITCKANVTDQPSPSPRVGTEFGLLTCRGALGSGVDFISFKQTPTSPTTAMLVGQFKWFFDRGTLHGKIKLTITIAGPTDLRFVGIQRFTAGTGAFAGVAGSSKTTCLSTDAVHSSCTSTLTLAGL